MFTITVLRELDFQSVGRAVPRIDDKPSSGVVWFAAQRFISAGTRCRNYWASSITSELMTKCLDRIASAIRAVPPVGQQFASPERYKLAAAVSVCRRPYPLSNLKPGRDSPPQILKPLVSFDALPCAPVPQEVLTRVEVSSPIDRDRKVKQCSSGNSNDLRLSIAERSDVANNTFEK